VSKALPSGKKLDAQERLKIVLGVVEKNRPVSNVCEQAGISRSFFYKLKRKYLEAGESRKEKLRALEPRREWKRNGRQLSRDQIKEIVAVILENPEDGIPRILRQIEAKNHQKVPPIAKAART